MNRVTRVSYRRHLELLDVKARLPIISAFHIPE